MGDFVSYSGEWPPSLPVCPGAAVVCSLYRGSRLGSVLKHRRSHFQSSLYLRVLWWSYNPTWDCAVGLLRKDVSQLKLSCCWNVTTCSLKVPLDVDLPFSGTPAAPHLETDGFLLPYSPVLFLARVVVHHHVIKTAPNMANLWSSI